ncbi:MAG TPA: hypothetical protein VF705_09745, partial [Longimicrobium sp.]
GRYADTNYAVPARTITECLRATGRDEAPLADRAAAEPRTVEALHAPHKALDSARSFTIPIRVTVSADPPVTVPGDEGRGTLLRAGARREAPAPVGRASNKFTLEIAFRCMCCFVPDERTGRMHVLMPDTRGHEHAGHGGRSEVDPHAVNIVYPKEGGSLLEGTAEVLAMEDWTLEIDADAGAANLKLPTELVDLCPVGGTISRSLLGDKRDPRVISRITLGRGSATHQVSGAYWQFNGEKRKMAQEIIWTIPDIAGDRLTWSRTRLTSRGTPGAEDIEALPDLFPADDGVLRLEVHHVLASDFPRADPDRKPEVSAAHFAAYYNLCENPSRRELPRFIERIPETPSLTCITCTTCLKP